MEIHISVPSATKGKGTGQVGHSPAISLAAWKTGKSPAFVIPVSSS